MKKIIIMFTVLLTLNIFLSLWSLYYQRMNVARTCLAITSLQDNVMTKLNGTVNDKRTIGLLRNCTGGSMWLVPGF